MNIIWNKQEISKINKTILIKTNLKLNENNELTIVNNKHLGSKNNTANSIYQLIYTEIIELFNFQDRQEIEKVLTKAKDTQFDPHNKLHHGLIACLSKTNPENHTYIFDILREIASQYERVIASVAYKTLDSYDNSTQMMDRIKEITNSQEETLEEIEIKCIMKNIFTFTNGITEESIYKPLIEKCNSLIKERLIFHSNQKLISVIKSENYKEENDAINHHIDFDKKFQITSKRILQRKYNLYKNRF